MVAGPDSPPASADSVLTSACFHETAQIRSPSFLPAPVYHGNELPGRLYTSRLGPRIHYSTCYSPRHWESGRAGKVNAWRTRWLCDGFCWKSQTQHPLKSYHDGSVSSGRRYQCTLVRCSSLHRPSTSFGDSWAVPQRQAAANEARSSALEQSANPQGSTGSPPSYDLFQTMMMNKPSRQN